MNKISNIENKKDWLKKNQDKDEISKSNLYDMGSSDDSQNNEEEEDDAARSKNGQ